MLILILFYVNIKKFIKRYKRFCSGRKSIVKKYSLICQGRGRPGCWIMLAKEMGIVIRSTTSCHYP